MIDAFLSGFQVVIIPFDFLPNGFSNAIIFPFWIVSDFFELTLSLLDALLLLTFFTVSTFNEPLILLSCLSRPMSSCMGKSLEDSPSSYSVRFSVLFATFSRISWSLMSSALPMSNVEGSPSSTLFSIMACRAVTLPSMGMLKPKSRRSFYPISLLSHQLTLANYIRSWQAWLKKK